jgi:putative membrane protein
MKVWFFFSGVLMGIANVVPGVSGGTIAVLMGIYEKLIESVNSFFHGNSKSLKVLIPVGTGVLVGIFGIARFLEISLSKYPIPTHFFFLGLVIVSFVKTKEYFSIKPVNIFFVLLGMFLIFMLHFSGGTTAKENMFLLVLAGFVAAMAMVVPGISGSLILLIFGVYDYVLYLVSHLIIGELLIFSIGVVAGILVSVKIMNFLLKRFREETYSFIGGMILASLYEVLPKKMNTNVVLPSILSLVLSLTLGFFLLYIEKKLSVTQKL